MEMHQILYFIALSEEGNFSRAAAKCNVAQPSLSKAIKSLEEEFGGLLFNRERSCVRMTELGRIISPHLLQVYCEAKTAKARARGYVRIEDAPLKLGVMCTIPPRQFMQLFDGLYERFPGVRLEIVDGTARTLRERLISGAIDAAIICPPPDDPASKFHFLPLFKEAMVIVIGANHPLGKNKSIYFGDLDNGNYVMRTNCEFNCTLDPEVQIHTDTWNPIMRSERDDWVLELVSRGTGFGFIPISCAVYEGVKICQVIDMNISRVVHLATVRGRQHPPAVGALLREVAKIDWQIGLTLKSGIKEDQSEQAHNFTLGQLDHVTSRDSVDITD